MLPKWAFKIQNIGIEIEASFKIKSISKMNACRLVHAFDKALNVAKKDIS